MVDRERTENAPSRSGPAAIRERRLASGLVGSVGLALAVSAAPMVLVSPAHAIEGRYVGSLIRTEIGEEATYDMRHLYDVRTRRATPGGLDMMLGASLSHRSRPGESGTSLLRTRFLGELSSQSWRLRGQLEPWQDVANAASAPRQRILQLGLDVTRAGLPDLSIDYARRDRDTPEGLSRSEDRRVELSYAFSGIGVNTAYREVDTQPALASRAASARTQELRGGLVGTGRWRGGSAQLSYDFLRTFFRSRERRRDQRTHRVGMSGSWSPGYRVRVGVNALARFGQIEDNGLPDAQDPDERTVGAQLEYEPLHGLSLEVAREYRLRQLAAGDAVTDYTRGRVILQRALTRSIGLQTGYNVTVHTQSEGGGAPTNDAFLILDGRLRRNLQGRGELRASRSSGAGFRGTQWRQLVQLRSRPSANSRVELTWRRDVLPQVDAAIQRDGGWDLVVGYTPWNGSSLTASMRTNSGRGRVARSERAANLTASWRLAPSTSLSADLSRRTNAIVTRTSRETTIGINVKSRLPSDIETQLSLRRVSGSDRGRATTVGMSVSRNF